MSFFAFILRCGFTLQSDCKNGALALLCRYTQRYMNLLNTTLIQFLFLSVVSYTWSSPGWGRGTQQYRHPQSTALAPADKSSAAASRWSSPRACSAFTGYEGQLPQINQCAQPGDSLVVQTSGDTICILVLKCCTLYFVHLPFFFLLYFNSVTLLKLCSSEEWVAAFCLFFLT